MRGQSRLLVLERASGAIQDRRFVELPSLLRRGDLLVVNNTRVFAARLIGRRLPGGGAAECLLVRPLGSASVAGASDAAQWEALVHPGQRLKEGSRLEFGAEPHIIHGEVQSRRWHGRRSVILWTTTGTLQEAVDAIGHIPLPPYIKRPDATSDRERYQTVYARHRGSIAAPTAGLHFTEAIFSALDAAGIERTEITLHVGYGTFQPIRTERIEEHRMEEEHYEIGSDAAHAIRQAQQEGRRIVAVGTTVTRALESAALKLDGRIEPCRDLTNLFIVPGHRFRVVSGLITNFHLPRSSLLLLVSAFAGRERTLAAYRHAIDHGYRFYSYGDANLIT